MDRSAGNFTVNGNAAGLQPPRNLSRSVSTRSALHVPMNYDPEIGEDNNSSQGTPSNSFDNLPAYRSRSLSLGRKKVLSAENFQQTEPMLGINVAPAEAEKEAFLKSVNLQVRCQIDDELMCLQLLSLFSMEYSLFDQVST